MWVFGCIYVSDLLNNITIPSTPGKGAKGANVIYLYDTRRMNSPNLIVVLESSHITSNLPIAMVRKSGLNSAGNRQQHVPICDNATNRHTIHSAKYCFCGIRAAGIMAPSLPKAALLQLRSGQAWITLFRLISSLCNGVPMVAAFPLPVLISL